MVQQIIDLVCPRCGGPIAIGETICQYCYSPVVISTFHSVYSMPIKKIKNYTEDYKKFILKNPNSANDKELNNSIAMCYLKLRLYDQAYDSFVKAIEGNFDNSETYFYAAVSLLRGKKAFLAQRKDINKAIEYIDAANMIEPKGIYYYFLAYIKYDFFERKYLNTSPNYLQCLTTARNLGVSNYDINMLFDILGVTKPSLF